MFVARTGIKTRNGVTENQQSGLTALLGPRRRQQGEKVAFLCWIPFMWRPCLAGVVGLLVLLGGAAMSVIGYYAQDMATFKTSNGTHTFNQVNSNKRFHLNNLTYLGPVVMGCGCFIMVVACVVICDQRDKKIRLKIEELKKKKIEKAQRKKKTAYDLVVDRLKTSDVYREDEAKRAVVAETAEEKHGASGASKEKSSSIHSRLFPCVSDNESLAAAADLASRQSFQHISSALMSIPMDIFAIEATSSDYTLKPVPVDAAHTDSASLRTAALQRISKSESSLIPSAGGNTKTGLKDQLPGGADKCSTSDDVTGRDPMLACQSDETVITSEIPLKSPASTNTDNPQRSRSRDRVTDEADACSDTEAATADISSAAQCSEHATTGQAQDDAGDDRREIKPDSAADRQSHCDNAVPSLASPGDITAPAHTPVARSSEEGARHRNVFYHQASIHADESGSEVSAAQVDLVTSQQLDDVEMMSRLVAIEANPARGNAVGMDTFRQIARGGPKVTDVTKPRKAFMLQKQKSMGKIQDPRYDSDEDLAPRC